MKKLSFLLALFIIGSGLAQANLVIEPVNIPAKYSDEDVLNMVEYAAKYRGWTIIDVEKDRLTINIVRQGYDSTLEFFVDNKKIQYEDDTTARIRLPRKARKRDDRWRDSAVPVDWVNMIVSDVNNSLSSEDQASQESKLEMASVESTIGPGCKEQLSARATEKRLKSLKRMYRKKLINRNEYENKKSEVLSCF